MTDSAETPVNKGSRKNRAGERAPDSERPIRSEESGAVVARIAEVIGEEPVASFARRCGLKESVLRSYINDGRAPPILNALAIATAGGVLVDWLATGRPPKTRAELVAAGHSSAEERAVYNRETVDRARLRLALVMADDAARLITEPVTPERRADLVLAFYDRLEASNDKP